MKYVLLNFFLLQLMEFKNHVLLREVDLHENDLYSLDAISDAWLPSLQRINFGGNRYVIESMVSIVLKELSKDPF